MIAKDKSKLRGYSVLCLVLFSIGSGLAQVDVDPAYTITDLGPLPEGFTPGWGFDWMNFNGYMAGFTLDPPTRAAIGFIGDGMLVIGTLGGDRAIADAVNSRGQVTGHVSDCGQPINCTRAFYWDGVTEEVLGTLGGSYSQGQAIDAIGRIAGNSKTTSGEMHAFYWDGTTLSDIGGPGIASGISPNSGFVTGRLQLNQAQDCFEGDLDCHAFLWNGIDTIPLLGFADSAGTAVNSIGQVTGYQGYRNTGISAFLWDGLQMRNLGGLGGGLAAGNGINVFGEVTGGSETERLYEDHAFLWDGTRMVDLGMLVRTEGEQCSPGWSEGYEINALGQVLGISIVGCDIHAVRWDPVEPRIPVSLDVQPGKCPSPLEIRKEVVTTAIAGTPDLDPYDVDVGSLRLLGIPPTEFSYRDFAVPFEPMLDKELDTNCTDARRDGFTDLVLKFETSLIVEVLETYFQRGLFDGDIVTLPLKGNLTSGQTIVGEDVVVVAEKRGGGPGGEKENCRNGVDDNGDGLVDCDDPLCANKGFCRP